MEALECRDAVWPAELKDLESSLDIGDLVRSRVAHESAAALRIEKNETAYSIGMTGGAAQCAGTAVGHSKERELPSISCGDDGFEVIVIFVERKINAFPIGETAAPPIKPHERVALRELRKPRPPNRAVPIGFEMMQPMLHPDQQRARTANRVGDPGSIATDAEADLLRRGKHLPCQYERPAQV